MNALTFHQPWAWLISIDTVPMQTGFDQIAPKRIENRTWRPWRSAVGKPLAIHAGKFVDEDAIDTLLGLGVDVPEKWFTMAIIATAKLSGSSASQPGPGSDQAVWHVGPVVWLLADVKALPSPVFTPGKQGIWTVSGQAMETLGFLLDAA